jgi:hypothetical protein
MFQLATVRSPANCESAGSSYGITFRGPALGASLFGCEKIDLHNSAAVLTKTGEVASCHEISHASTDHDADVQPALACRSDL